MDKKDYIVNQLKRTFNKKFENYCITRIYHLLNRNDIQIVTQQMFRRNDGKIALADLYFPQLNIWIEIDESQHLGRKKDDEQRTKEVIKNKLKKLEEVVNIVTLGEPIRIKVYSDENGKNISIDEINEQIDYVIKTINNKILELGENFVPWDCKDKNPHEYINKIIRLEDNIKFHTIKECTKIFKKMNDKYKVCTAWFNIKDNYNLWCPKLKLEKNDFINLPWKNEINNDGTIIYEKPKTMEDNEFSVEQNNEIRITFAYYKDENMRYMYKFRGIFVLDKLSTKNENFKRRVWKKISNEFDLSIL